MAITLASINIQSARINGNRKRTIGWGAKGILSGAGEFASYLTQPISKVRGMALITHNTDKLSSYDVRSLFSTLETNDNSGQKNGGSSQVLLGSSPKRYSVESVTKSIEIAVTSLPVSYERPARFTSLMLALNACRLETRYVALPKVS